MACCGKGQSQMPGLVARGASVMKALAYWGLSGFKTTSEEVYTERMEACHTCDQLVNESTCAKCGCFVTKKALLATEKCPLDRWKPLEKVEEVTSSPHSSGDLKKLVRPVPSREAQSSCTHENLVTHTRALNKENNFSVSIRVMCRSCGLDFTFPDRYGGGSSIEIALTPGKVT